MAKDYILEKRKFVIGGIAISIVLIYLIRLFVLQITTDDYKKNADSNAFLNKIQYPSRGAIYDRTGKPLREMILRERAVEFGYEEVRYFDLVRWKRADIFTGQLSRLIIKKAAGEPSGFSYTVSHAMAETRQYAKPEKWNDKYFLLPLPVDEINKKYGLIQNPGW